MNVLHLSTSDRGGAAGAARRIHLALRDAGMDSHLLVASASGPPPDGGAALDDLRYRAWGAVWPRVNAALMRGRYPRRHGVFTPDWLHQGLSPEHPLVRAADVVCLYWVAGFVDGDDLVRLGKPLVWRLSDEWAYTGGCHYAGSCRRYEEACGACPSLGSADGSDVSARGLARKVRSYPRCDLTIVAPSRWIAARAAASRALAGRTIETVPTGVRLDVFRPMERSAARAAAGLPADGPVVLFGGSGATRDPRKGLDLLLQALRSLSSPARPAAPVRLAVFGDDAAVEAPVPVVQLGAIGDPARLAAVYAAADVVAVPSREDNLPQVALEAIACGTPVVAFDVGGVAEAIDQGQGGLAVAPFDVGAFGEGLRWGLGAGEPARRAARAWAEAHFDLAVQTRRYADLLRGAVARNRAPRQ